MKGGVGNGDLDSLAGLSASRWNAALEVLAMHSVPASPADSPDGVPSNDVSALLSEGRIVATYRLRVAAAEARALAEAIAVELTVEVPDALIDRYPHLRPDIVARIETLAPFEDGSPDSRLVLSFAGHLADGGLPQLVNLLSGNVSMLPGVELLDAEFPPAVSDRFRGPRHGIAGLRARLEVTGRPIVATALKPRGAPLADLEKVAEAFARGGGEVIKDDHNLVEGTFEEYRERVLRIRDAVSRGNDAVEGRCLYHALLTGPLGELERRLLLLEDEEIDGVLVAPMLLGLEGTRHLLADTDLFIWTHPSFTGAVAHPAGSAVHPAFLHGTLFRALGADAAVFVNHGGRFPISRADCVAIADQCRRPRGAWKRTFPVPAGGMRFDRIEAMAEDFGADTILLIGGDLLIRPEGVEKGTRAFIERVEGCFSGRGR